MLSLCSKALTWRDAIFIDHTQCTEAHVRRIVVVGERKGVEGLEPPMVGIPMFN